MSWEHSKYEKAFAVFLTAGCDELPTPDAIFQTEEEAKEYIERERVKAMLDSLGYPNTSGAKADAIAEGHKPEDYLHEAGMEAVRNLFIPWWNSTEDVPEEAPCPIDEYELADLVRLNAPQEGEGTLAAVERRLAEWHFRKYGPRPIDINRTVIKLGEEFGELCRAILRGDKSVAQEAADIAFVLFHIVRALGYSLTNAINQKLPIIESRLIDPNAGR